MTNNKMEFFYWRLPAMIWAAFILALTSYPTINVPDLGFNAIDKIAHIGVYFILGFLVFRALAPKNTPKSSALAFKTFAICFLFAVFDEAHQLFIPGRFAELLDLSADIIGILFGTLTFFLLPVKTKEKADRVR
jgi:VanZ family protein